MFYERNGGERGGRPTSCTPAVIEIVARTLAVGNHVHVAATRAGIHKSTLYTWMERGEQGEEPYATFYAKVHEAMAEAEAAALALVQEAASGWVERTTEMKKDPDGKTITVRRVVRRDWRAAAWFLQRRFSERWGAAGDSDLAGAIKRLAIDVDPSLYLGAGGPRQGDQAEDEGGPTTPSAN